MLGHVSKLPPVPLAKSSAQGTSASNRSRRGYGGQLPHIPSRSQSQSSRETATSSQRSRGSSRERLRNQQEAHVNRMRSGREIRAQKLAERQASAAAEVVAPKSPPPLPPPAGPPPESLASTSMQSVGETAKKESELMVPVLFSGVQELAECPQSASESAVVTLRISDYTSKLSFSSGSLGSKIGGEKYGSAASGTLSFSSSSGKSHDSGGIRDSVLCEDHGDKSLPSNAFFLRASVKPDTAVFISAALQQESAAREAELAHMSLPQAQVCSGQLDEHATDLQGHKSLTHPLEGAFDQQVQTLSEECKDLDALRQGLNDHEQTLKSTGAAVANELRELQEQIEDHEQTLKSTGAAVANELRELQEQIEDHEQTLKSTGAAVANELRELQEQIEAQESCSIPESFRDAATQELAQRWDSLRRGQLEVQRQREELSEKQTQWQERLEYAEQQQREVEKEKDKFEERWQNYKERWQSLRAKQLEFEIEKASHEKLKDDLQSEIVGLREELERGQEEHELLIQRREMVESLESDLQSRQKEAEHNKALLDFRKQEMNKATERVKQRERESEQLQAELEKERRTLEGWKQQLQEALSGVQTSLPIQLPSHWCGSRKIRVPWPEGRQAILSWLQQAALHPTCAGRDGTFCLHEIRGVNVWRLEHDILWSRYCSKKEEILALHRKRKIDCRMLVPPVANYWTPTFPQCLDWASTFNAGCNEVFLWHGTRHQNIDIICKAGMDERVCQLSGMFGAGIYFAQDSCKSGQYAQRDSRGSRWFLLSRVVLGNPYIAHTAMPQTRRPPDKFDSVVYEPNQAQVGQVGQHREFMVYDRSQVYSEYVIEAFL
eukprot:TRINITY_DN3676_c0_g1_i1.p1 TRINITY_DN3676_c0_g1~~TRINITY_DN3676_c0_g1_i1.p1  ORF type:complete len:838 (+),score=166.78 TRINITY_DN3676_c0_g1_i1:79-2592(+)